MYVATYVQSTKVTSVAIITVANEFYPHSYVCSYTVRDTTDICNQIVT